MAGVPLKMKRKDIERVNEDFSDFSLSSPARKIRRLDLDLPPILEEEEPQSAPVNEERAIVLFKPQHHHPPTGNLYVDRDLISGFKNRFFHTRDVADDLCDDDADETNKHQALIRWEPSQFHFMESAGTVQDPPEPKIVELDGEDTVMDEAAMDVDEENSSSGTSVSLPQWQQQQLHCMIPQLPQTNSTPISWYR